MYVGHITVAYKGLWSLVKLCGLTNVTLEYCENNLVFDFF